MCPLKALERRLFASCHLTRHYKQNFGITLMCRILRFRMYPFLTGMAVCVGRIPPADYYAA